MSWEMSPGTLLVLYTYQCLSQAGTRPHVIFAKGQVRITVYDDGREKTDQEVTGFEADIDGED